MQYLAGINNIKMIKSTWLSAHIFFDEPWEPFLLNVVKPLTKTLLKKKLITQYFFIRYWENGPHIRLRLKGNTHVLENEVRPFLTDWVNDAFTKDNLQLYFHDAKNQIDPSETAINNSIARPADWYPLYSIQFIPYVPEIKRYGGQHAIGLAESFFQLSSDTVLKIIGQSNDWRYEDALGAAIQMHLSFAFAFNFTPDELRYFFNLIFESWFNHLFLKDTLLLKDEFNRQSEPILHAFQDSFNKQKELLIPYHKQVWLALKNDDDLENNWVKTWVKKLRVIDLKLNKLINDGHFICPFTVNKPINNKEKLMLIFESYIHMTNNRLGILNRDEAFLGYLIKNSMEQVDL